MPGVNYMGGSKNAHQRKNSRHQEDLSGTPAYRPLEAPKSTTSLRRNPHKNRGLAGPGPRQAPEIGFVFALSSVPPRTKAQPLEFEDPSASLDEEAYQMQQRCQEILREEAAKARVAASSVENEKDDGALADPRARAALLNTPNWTETSHPAPPSKLKPALKRSSAQGQMSAEAREKASKSMFIPRPRHGSTTSAFGRPPAPPATSKPRYQARCPRSPTAEIGVDDEVQALEALLRAPGPSAPADYAEEHQLAQLHAFPALLPPEYPSYNSQPLAYDPSSHLGSEPMDLGSEGDAEESEILEFSQDVASTAHSKIETLHAPSSSTTAATIGSSSTLAAISASATANQGHPPVASPSFSPSTLPQPPAASPPALLDDPYASFYLISSSLEYWNTLASSMNLEPLSPSFVDPEYISWTGPCCTTRRQREDLKDVFIFDAFEEEDLEPMTSVEREEDGLVVQERMGLGCRGVKKEEAGSFDMAMLNVGWEGWDDDAEAAVEGQEDDGEDPGELVDEQQLWNFAVESKTPKAASPIVLCPETPPPSPSPSPTSAPAATTLSAIADGRASSPPISTFDMVDLGLVFSAGADNRKPELAKDSAQDVPSSSDPLAPKAEPVCEG